MPLLVGLLLGGLWRKVFRFGLQLKSDLKEMEERLEMKIEEAEEAREMNGVYSAKLTRLERKFKKLRDQDEESYIEMTF